MLQESSLPELLNSKSESHTPLLHFVCVPQKWNPTLLLSFLKLGALPTATNAEGQTCLHVCVSKGIKQII